MSNSSQTRCFVDPRKPVTPVLIPLLFWLGVIACLVIAIFDFVLLAAIYGSGQWPDDGREVMFGPAKWMLILRGIGALTIGPLLWYIFCEVLATFFHMNRNIEDIRNGGITSKEE